jgi:predicted negative regulator of RcsB-dependent stress response
MGRIYIRFENREERNEFLLDLLDLRTTYETLMRTKRRTSDQKSALASIKGLLEGVDSYHRLNRTFYNGRVPKSSVEAYPASPANIFRKGVRSLHTQQSYMHRPGEWLAVGLRNTREAWGLYCYIQENVPKEQIGTNVPLPQRVALKQDMKLVARIIDGSRTESHAAKALGILTIVKDQDPDLFRGNRIYLWEDMARLFYELGDIRNAVHCLQQMAELRPTDSDPYLNMGVILAWVDDIEGAISAYMQGLAVEPASEFISFNLSSLLMKEDSDTALKHIEEAIAKNPERGLNYKLKGDILLWREDHRGAITEYETAVPLFDDSWKAVKDECLLHLAAARENLENTERLSIVYEEGQGVSITLTESLRTRIKLWQSQHECQAVQKGIGVGETYSVTETSIGTMLSVTCCCGDRLLVYPDDPLEF